MDCDKYFQTLEQYNTHLYYHKQKEKHQEEKEVENIININNNNNNKTKNIKKNHDINMTIIQKIDEVSNKQNLILNNNIMLKNENIKIKKNIEKASSLVNFLMDYHSSILPVYNP
jgi:hypothetical protein